MKAMAEEFAATVPGITLDVVNTDTTSAYSADYSFSGVISKIRLYNSSNSAKIRIGTNLGGTSNTDYVENTIGYINNSAGTTLRVCITSGSMFIGQCVILILTSMADGSNIEVFGYGTTHRVVGTGGTTYAVSITVPKISDTQAATLPGNTVFLAEGILNTASPSAKAPYLLNGHGPYSWSTGTSFGSQAIISNGSEYFFLYSSNYAFRL